jgi:SAM-dependent methyltransferase
MMTARNTEDAFRNVDEAADPQALIAYLDAVAKDGGLGATFKQRGIAELRLQPGMAVLDAGCGTGQDVLAFAAAVGPVGRAVGVDGSATMIAEARTRAATAGVPSSRSPTWWRYPSPTPRSMCATPSGCSTTSRTCLPR